MRHLHSSLAIVALVLCGCEAATSPDEGVTIGLSVAATRGPTLADSPNGPYVSCDLDLDAQASGHGTASWLDASFRFFIGRDTITAAAAGTVSRDEVQASWQAPNITAGETRHSTWTVSAGLPFSGAIDFRYQPSSGGAASTTTVHFRCTQTIPDNAPPPQLSITSVTPPSGTLPSGGSVQVTYSASAAAGLWQTMVQLSGPCDVQQLFSEKLQPTVTRTAVIPLPAACALGVPIQVTIGAQDALAQEAYRAQPTNLLLVDEVAPSLSMVQFLRPDGAAQSLPYSTYFGGDSIPVMIGASDNHALAYIDWEIKPFGVRDSIAVSGQAVSRTIRIPLRPEWSGPIQLSLDVRDASGYRSAVVTTPSNSMTVYPRIAHPVNTGSYSGNARAVAVDSRRGLIYLALGNERQISILSAATLRVTGTLSLPGAPVDLDITPGGDSLLVAMYGSRALGVVDLRATTLALTPIPLSALDSAAGQGTMGVRALADGHAMIAVGANQLARTALLDVDLATGAQRLRADAAVNGITGVNLLARSADGRVIAMNNPDTRCLRRYDVQSDSFGACATPRVSDMMPALDSTGQRISLHTDVYDAGMNLLPSGLDLTPGSVTYSVLSADGNTLLQFAGNMGLLSRDAATGRILGKTPYPYIADLPPRLSADGRTLVVVTVYIPGSMIGTVDLH